MKKLVNSKYHRKNIKQEMAEIKISHQFQEIMCLLDPKLE